MVDTFGRLALHTWTIDTTPLALALDAVRAAGYDAVELRRIDFTRCYDAGMSRAQVRDLIRGSGVKVGILGVEYGWLFARGDESKRLFSLLRETCEDATALGCDMLMCAPGQISAPLPEAVANLKTGADIVAEFGLRIAIEFNSQHAVLNRVGVLRDLLVGAGKPNCGYLLDAYHITRSGDGARAFEDVPGKEIFVFQYSDVPPRPVPEGIKRPTDRLAPGTGIVEWREMFGLLAQKGYTGYLSYEAPNPEFWARSPYDVAHEGLELTRKLLREAIPSYAA